MAAPVELVWTPLDHAHILDISGGGLQLQTSNGGLAAGDHVSLEFRFDGREYRLRAQVTWARRGQFGRATRAGLEFDDMQEGEREALVRDIYRAQLAAARLRHR